MCAWVAAMTTVAHNKIKQYSFNAKVNFSFVLPYTWCSLLSITTLTFSQFAPYILLTCYLSAWNMITICSILSPDMPWSHPLLSWSKPYIILLLTCNHHYVNLILSYQKLSKPSPNLLSICCEQGPNILQILKRDFLCVGQKSFSFSFSICLFMILVWRGVWAENLSSMISLLRSGEIFQNIFKFFLYFFGGEDGRSDNVTSWAAYCS